MKEILQHPNDILRAHAELVSIEEIQTSAIQQVIIDMQEALAHENDGVAIAAPQIGIPKRIFVVAGRVFKEDTASNEPHQEQEEILHKDAVFINPEIITMSKDKEWLDEGCLSVRPKYGKVERATKVKIRAYTETGEKIERGASGLLAQIFQHEIDHLNGILFIDKARQITDVPADTRGLDAN